MQKHWKGIQWFMIAVATVIIVAFIKGWLFLVYAVAAAAGLVGFIYLIAVTRFDDHPSDEEETELERSKKHSHEPRRVLKGR